MDKRKTCKGCGTVVVKPVVCNRCNLASHPGCLTRTGHPHSNNRLLDCGGALSVAQFDGLIDPSLISVLTDILCKEFAVFREEMRAMHRAEVESLKDDVVCRS